MLGISSFPIPSTMLGISSFPIPFGIMGQKHTRAASFSRQSAVHKENSNKMVVDDVTHRHVNRSRVHTPRARSRVNSSRGYHVSREGELGPWPFARCPLTHLPLLFPLFLALLYENRPGRETSQYIRLPPLPSSLVCCWSLRSSAVSPSDHRRLFIA